jgi:hypothetical protein
MLSTLQSTRKTRGWRRGIALGLISLNAAWLMVWYQRVRSHVLFSWNQAAFYLQHLSWHLRLVEPATVLEQVVWSLALSMPIFMLLLLLTYVQRLPRSIGLVAWCFCVSGFPAYALCFPFDFPFHFYPPPLSDFSSPPLIIVGSNRIWLALETAAVLFGGILFYVRKWLAPLVPTILLLFLHFSLWAWLTHSYVTPEWEARAYGSWSSSVLISTACSFGFPVLGFISTLCTDLYLRRADDSLMSPLGYEKNKGNRY